MKTDSRLSAIAFTQAFTKVIRRKRKEVRYLNRKWQKHILTIEDKERIIELLFFYNGLSGFYENTTSRSKRIRKTLAGLYIIYNTINML